MNQDIKKLWVDALLSGKYKQGFGQNLRHDENGDVLCHCALGVLIDIYAQEHNITWDNVTLKLEAMLPKKVVEWAEFRGSDINLNEYISINKRNLPLYKHNDNRTGFSVIAQAINEQL